MPAVTFDLNNIFFGCTLVLMVALYVQMQKTKHAKEIVQSYRTLNKELVSNEGAFRQHVLDLHHAVENEAGGIKRRIDENLHLSHDVQHEAPELLVSLPALVQVLEANQQFFECLNELATVEREH